MALYFCIPWKRALHYSQHVTPFDKNHIFNDIELQLLKSCTNLNEVQFKILNILAGSSLAYNFFLSELGPKFKGCEALYFCLIFCGNTAVRIYKLLGYNNLKFMNMHLHFSRSLFLIWKTFRSWLSSLIAYLFTGFNLAIFKTSKKNLNQDANL